ncbi:MFS transporter [Proteiniclasticum ruminis]|uniref:Glycoside/pentoside/hexuronide:cation symporter, GPH family n=1 Tax=Proteiniclasticum ruminis TaxID=398199 RepID=A0A1I4YZ56_9CLOT|nr:glycoside-pentoside-hexuronide (GPH):cation symporter [Proteiniclasticum ruminis]SFN43063.1 glycoside/pentoside/hexuronide:cation symporter, GPH family [Proteiniclasticum ruminis]
MKKFGIRDQVGYLFGDMAGSFVNLYVDAFFLTFCTYVLGVSPYFMASLFLGARLWDAVNDPIIGSFPDRWSLGKSGDKFKPYIKVAMFPLALSVMLAFYDVSLWSETAKHIWIVAVYVFYGMCYTGTSMPYGSLVAVITDDPVERTKLSRARSFGGLIVGAGFLSAVPQFIFNKEGHVVPENFFYIGILFGVLSLLSYILTLKLTTERVRQKKVETEKFNYSKVLKSVLKNRPLIGVMVATVGSLLYITGNSQLGAYIYKEYYHAPQLLTLVSLSSIPIMFVAFPVIPKLSAKYGKRNLILLSTAVNFVFSLFLLIVPIKDVYLFLLLYTISNVGQTVFIMLIWALVTDTLDYHEYITGERSDGSLFSIYTFSRKIGSTLASTLASMMLGIVGFVSGAAAQTPEVAENIRTLTTAVPVLTTLLQLIGIGLIFNLSKERMDEIQLELKNKRLSAAN